MQLLASKAPSSGLVDREAKGLACTQHGSGGGPGVLAGIGKQTMLACEER
jgi:hypothetical protein